MKTLVNGSSTNLSQKFLLVIGSIFVVLSFFISISIIGGGFSNIGQGASNSFILAISNPFIGLFVGLLVTAILQSSSTTTTMTVALVATNTIPLAYAVPIVIGANIGTTLTSTLVSLSYITRTKEFVKAFSAGIVHDLFNISVALILFPLELKYQFLSRLSSAIASYIPIYKGSFSVKGVDKFFAPITQFLLNNLGSLVTIFLGIVLLFGTVKLVSNLIYKFWEGKASSQSVFRSNMHSFSWGLLITSAIQSSSLSTSLMVPLVATNKVTINRAFAFIIGANLGTTVTALIAALFQSEVAISLAIAHLIFNLIGCLLFIMIPYLFRVITVLSNQLAILTLRNRVIGLVYILFTFFVLPFTLIYISTGDHQLAQKHHVVSSIDQKPLPDLHE